MYYSHFTYRVCQNVNVKFKVCKSVHHRTIQINHQPEFFSLLFWRLFTAQHVSGVFPPIIRSSMTAVADSGFTFVLWWQSCCDRGRAGRPARPRTQHDCHHDTKVKPETATAVTELLMMGGKTPETCWAVNKRQVHKLKNCCIRLVIYLKCTMMHGLKNLKFYI
jgi:hypothetical protein